MTSDDRITLSEIYDFLKASERKNSGRFDELENKIKNLNRKHEKIMTAISALLYNNRNDFECVEVRFKILEAKILKALGVDTEDVPDEESNSEDL